MRQICIFLILVHMSTIIYNTFGEAPCITNLDMPCGCFLLLSAIKLEYYYFFHRFNSVTKADVVIASIH